MSKLIVTGIFIAYKWKIHRETDNEWKAWIPDYKDSDTGAPLLTAIGFEQLIEKIQIFEQGGAHASRSD